MISEGKKKLLLKKNEFHDFTDKMRYSLFYRFRDTTESIASTRTSPAPVTEIELEGAIVQDLQWSMGLLEYKGVPLSKTRFEKWAGQFPKSMNLLAAHLVREIASHYFISAGTFHQIIQTLIDSSGVERGGSVTFCRWESLGKSSARVANELKNQGQWKVGREIDLGARPETWPTIESREAGPIILADDFIGSGKSISRLFRSAEAPLAQLIRKYPNTVKLILVVAGFESGVRRVMSSVPDDLKNQIRVVPGKLYSEPDRCFSEQSRILPSQEQRRVLQEFCVETARTHFRSLRSEFRLGFGEVGALVVFSHTVPNNSLPIVWHNTGSWFPLFPASGVPT